MSRSPASSPAASCAICARASAVAAGQRMGIIRFGSRVDVYCPPPYVPMVAAGQRMVGGETVLADRQRLLFCRCFGLR